jgi:hypothetical protein
MVFALPNARTHSERSLQTRGAIQGFFNNDGSEAFPLFLKKWLLRIMHNFVGNVEYAPPKLSVAKPAMERPKLHRFP